LTAFFKNRPSNRPPLGILKSDLPSLSPGWVSRLDSTPNH
jgi:hypothetical protein